jgi:Protein of unknown function (DUF1295)
VVLYKYQKCEFTQTTFVQATMCLVAQTYSTSTNVACDPSLIRISDMVSKLVQGKFISEGLFKHARYPNYFGEMLTWTGMAVLCSSALHSQTSILMAFWSPAFTYLLLMYASGVPIQVCLHRTGLAVAVARWDSSVTLLSCPCFSFRRFSVLCVLVEYCLCRVLRAWAQP